jgi:multidrug efflux pump subunit AcrA (membrane-fusion protein)
LLSAGVVALLVSSVVWWGRGVGHSEIDVTATPMSPPPIHAEATLICQEGAEVTLGSQVAGRLRSIHVKEGETVHAGELLAEIDSSEKQAQFDEAAARLAASMIDEKFERLNLARTTQLSQQSAVSREEFDRAEHEMEKASAQTAINRAAVATLDVELRQSQIKAPFDAVVLQRLVNDQEEVIAGTPVLKLADLGRTWVEAQVDELDAPRVRLGAEADIAVEGDPDLSSRGQVVYIAPEMTARTEISADPSEPSRAQVLRVRIRIPTPAPFKLHERLEAAIETASAGAVADREMGLFEKQP